MSCMLSWLADDRDSTCCPSRLTECAPNYTISNRILFHFYHVTHYTSISFFVTMTQKSFRCFIRVTVRNLSNRIRKCLSITIIIHDNYLYQIMTMTPDAYEKYFSLSTNISVAIKFSQRWYCTKDSWKNKTFIF